MVVVVVVIICIVIAAGLTLPIWINIIFLQGKRRTALHWCATHGCEEEARLLVEFIKDGAGDSLRVVRFLDSQK